MDDKDSCVKVALRIRPQVPRERIERCCICTSVTPGEPQVTIGNDKAFTYDHVFDMHVDQERVYADAVEDLVEGCFEGYNATVLAYGQTGSGKTYTMGSGFEISDDGSACPPGIIPRAIKHLFAGIERRRHQPASGDANVDCAAANDDTPPTDLPSSSSSAATFNALPASFSVQVQFLELYNEEIIDLLDETRDIEARNRKSNIKIHEDKFGSIYITGASSQTVTSAEETFATLRTGALTRTTASTNMNAQSSRSHAIFTIHIKQERFLTTSRTIAQNGVGQTNGFSSEAELSDVEVLSAKFHFVDLAGSERLKRTGATGDRAKEGISINCGLLALGNVISALGDPTKQDSHVPYRDSKLTRLLQDSLGGNSRTLMIACISPSDCDFVETLNTLKYANRARNIKNKAVVNQDKQSQMLGQLRGEIQRLQLELLEFKQGKRFVNADGSESVNDVSAENALLLAEVNQLRVRVKALQETIDSLRNRNVLLASERASAIIANGENVLGGHDDSVTEASAVAAFVQKYMEEIEELKTRLLESESTCSILRRQLSRFGKTGPGGAILSSPIVSLPHEDTASSHLDDVKAVLFGSAKSSIKASASAALPSLAEEDLAAINGVLNGNHTNSPTKTILDEAKADIDKLKSKSELLKRKVNGVVMNGGAAENGASESEGAGTTTDDFESDSDSEEKENSGDDDKIQKDLADLLGEISIKERLVDELEQSQKRLLAIKAFYDEKLKQLQNRIYDTEMERDRVLATMETKAKDGQNNEKAQKIKADYEKSLSGLRGELKKLQNAQKEHTRISREQTRNQAELQKLQAELTEMKRAKVQLMQKMKEDANRTKQAELRRQQELAQARKDSRRQEHLISKLEAEKRSKDAMLKRKQEEVAALRKVQKPYSAKVSGQLKKSQENILKALDDRHSRRVFSPRMAKQRWGVLEKSITTLVTKKQTLLSLEQELERWLQKRETDRKQLNSLWHKRKTLENQGRDQADAELSLVCDEIESLDSNMKYIQDNLLECQQNIMAVEEANMKTNNASDIVDVEALLDDCKSLDEAKYLLEHLFNNCILQGVVAAQNESRLRECEANYQQAAHQLRVHQQLLNQVICGSEDLNNEVLDVMTSSTESAVRCPSPRFSSAEAFNFGDPGSACKDKARRRTATTDELLFADSPMKIVVSSADLLQNGLSAVAEDVEDEPTFTTRTRDCSPERLTSILAASAAQASNANVLSTQYIPSYASVAATNGNRNALSSSPRRYFPQFGSLTSSFPRVEETCGTGDATADDASLMPPPAVPPKSVGARKFFQTISNSRVGEFVRSGSLRHAKTNVGHSCTDLGQADKSTADADTSPVVLRRNNNNNSSFKRNSLNRSSFSGSSSAGLNRWTHSGSSSNLMNYTNGASGNANGHPPLLISTASYGSGWGVTPPGSPTSGVVQRRSYFGGSDDAAGATSTNVFSRLTDSLYLHSDAKLREKGQISECTSAIIKNSPLQCTHIAKGHSKAVLSICVTDEYLFSGSKDRLVKIWSLERGSEIKTLPAHANNVVCVRYSAPRDLLFSASMNCVKIWDLRTYECIRTFLSSGASQAGDKSPDTPSRQISCPPNESPINAMELDASGNFLFTASESVVRVWDLKAQLSIAKLNTSHTAQVNCMTFTVDQSNSDQSFLVTGSKDHTAKIFKLSSSRIADIHWLPPKRLQLNPPHYDGVHAVAANGSCLFSASRESLIKKWDLNSGNNTQNIINAHKDPVLSLRFLPAPNESVLVSSCREGYLKLWNSERFSGAALAEIRAHEQPVYDLATNSRCLFTASEDATIGIWKPNDDILQSWL